MDRLRFVVSLITNDNDYQRQQAAAAQQAAARLGVEMEALFAQNDAILQSQQLLDVIQSRHKRVDGILVEPAGRTAFPKVANAAVEAGIAWVVLNSEADYLAQLRKAGIVPVFAVSADNYEVGRIQGRQLAALLPGGGSVMYLQGPSQSSVTEQRYAGMSETKPDNVKMKLLKSVNWTEEGGANAVNSWLRLSTAQRERIDVVQAQNDFLAIGARRAFEEHISNLQHHNNWRMLFLGVDGLPKTGQAWVQQNILAATVVVPATAGQALTALAAAIREQAKQPERTLVAPESFPEINALTAKSVAAGVE